MRDGGSWQVVDVDEPSQTGAARRLAARLCEHAELPETAAAHVALAATELATNLVKHAVRGRLLARVHGQGADAVVDLLSIDQGPGMQLEQCFRDGYSTRGTSGTGLGAVRRLATAFDAYSDPRGSVLFARVGHLAGPRRGSVALALRGETVSGDQWTLAADDGGWSAMVADGLGHGPGAHDAATAAIAVHGPAPADPVRCLELAHAACRGTRGAAATVVRYDAAAGRLVHAGLGNVATSVLGRASAQGLASQNGTLGAHCPRVHPHVLDIRPDDLVVLHSDGLSARWSLDDYPGLRMRHPQVIAGVLFRDAGRARDDATVLVVQADTPPTGDSP